MKTHTMLANQLMSNGLLIKLIASRSESFMEMAEFVETHRGGKALHFEGYA